MTGALTALMSASSTRFNVAPGSYTHINLGTASCRYRLTAAGDIDVLVGVSLTDVGDWVTPKTLAGGAYQVRATLVSGTLSSGTTGVWTALSSDQSWAVARGSVGTQTATLNIEIRRTADSVVVASGSVTITAEAD